MSCGRLFHSRAPATAKAQSPTVEHCDWRTSSWSVSNDRRRCLDDLSDRRRSQVVSRMNDRWLSHAWSLFLKKRLPDTHTRVAATILSVRLSVTSRSTAKRWEIGLYLLCGAYRKSQPSTGLLRRPNSNPLRPPLPPKRGAYKYNLQSKVHRKWRQKTVVCIDSLWEHTIAL